jgi:probable HAF family extracellular repeat protein
VTISLKMLIQRAGLLFASLCVAFNPAALVAQTWRSGGFTIATLSTSTEFSRATSGRGINSQGQAVGYVRLPGPSVHAAVYTPGSGVADLGTMGGRSSSALAINETGSIAGFSQRADGSERAFRYDAGVGFRDLGTLGLSSYAYDINDRGQVVGHSYLALGQMRAFRYTEEAGIENLGSFGGNSGASGVNNHGQVVGFSELSPRGRRHAFRYTDGVGMQDLGTIGDAQSSATYINDAGQVVGYLFFPDGTTRAFRYSDEEGMIGLCEVCQSSFAGGIDNSGRIVVGTAQTSTMSGGVFWEDVEMHFLESLVGDDWRFRAIYSISADGTRMLARGYKAGEDSYLGAQDHIVLLEATGPSVIPEPRTLSLLATGILAFALAGRLRNIPGTRSKDTRERH